jgi:hypothetical protein
VIGPCHGRAADTRGISQPIARHMFVKAPLVTIIPILLDHPANIGWLQVRTQFELHPGRANFVEDERVLGISSGAPV